MMFFCLMLCRLVYREFNDQVGDVHKLADNELEQAVKYAQGVRI